MTDKSRILIVEDSAPQARLFMEYLKGDDVALTHAATGAEARRLIVFNPPDLILLDLRLPDDDGEDILAWVREQGFPSSVIVTTGHGSVDAAVDAMRLGADDFLEKPVAAQRLRTSVRNQLENRRLRDLVDDFQSNFERHSYHGFIGSSLPMQAVYRIVDAAAPSKATVFITGESGTGKEICAEAIHRQGERRDKPFVAINCGAIPHDLMESEIFGHVKGAFTGASSERMGAARQADGGTLFLDEIGEMSMDLQTKLLRFVQTGRFQKVGGSKEESVDVRFVCATNRDPLEAVAAGQFREDLYYRLHVVPVHLPPLRQRGEDITAIANHFLLSYAAEEGKRFQRFSPAVEVALRGYDWPGNVRQLQNVVRNIVVLHDGESVETDHLPPPLDQALAHLPVAATAAAPATGETRAIKSNEIRPLALVERETIEHAIAVCDGNIPRAAGLLEVSPSTIYRKKQAWADAE